VSNALLLLNRARERCHPPTWYQLAKQLDVSPQRMSNWTRGKHRPDIDVLFKLADFLGENRNEVLAVVLSEQHKGSLRSSYWEKLSPRVLPAAITALIVTGTLAQAHLTRPLSDGDEAGSALNPLYIMRTGLKYLRWLLREAATRLGPTAPRPLLA